MPAVMIASSPVSSTCRLERARQRQMQLGVLARQQVVVDDLAQQRVAELVAATGVGDDAVLTRRPRARRCAARRPPRPLASASTSCEMIRARRRAAAAPPAPASLRRSIPHHQRVAQRGRQPAAAVEPGGEQLFREQRVALAALVEALDQLGVRRHRRGCPRADRRARPGSARVSSIRRARVSRSSSASSWCSGWRRCSSSER